ncbi:hypothetical protein VP01_1785g1 [Puccinia sorghi]|uniref:Uncharacterized protein n=1 Tax=Puccinia sorghi TaxID=27349 RepID=A0A0L6VEP3_9BASI|nr:hypothetical protein VP01_1785g1 [Puccinia sorghi]
MNHDTEQPSMPIKNLRARLLFRPYGGRKIKITLECVYVVIEIALTATSSHPTFCLHLTPPDSMLSNIGLPHFSHVIVLTQSCTIDFRLQILCMTLYLLTCFDGFKALDSKVMTLVQKIRQILMYFPLNCCYIIMYVLSTVLMTHGAPMRVCNDNNLSRFKIRCDHGSSYCLNRQAFKFWSEACGYEITIDDGNASSEYLLKKAEMHTHMASPVVALLSQIHLYTKTRDSGAFCQWPTRVFFWDRKKELHGYFYSLRKKVMMKVLPVRRELSLHFSMIKYQLNLVVKGDQIVIKFQNETEESSERWTRAFGKKFVPTPRVSPAGGFLQSIPDLKPAVKSIRELHLPAKGYNPGPATPLLLIPPSPRNSWHPHLHMLPLRSINLTLSFISKAAYFLNISCQPNQDSDWDWKAELSGTLLRSAAGTSSVCQPCAHMKLQHQSSTVVLLTQHSKKYFQTSNLVPYLSPGIRFKPEPMSLSSEGLYLGTEFELVPMLHILQVSCMGLVKSGGEDIRFIIKPSTNIKKPLAMMKSCMLLFCTGHCDEGGSYSLSPKHMVILYGEKMPAVGRGVSSLSFKKTSGSGSSSKKEKDRIGLQRIFEIHPPLNQGPIFFHLSHWINIMNFTIWLLEIQAAKLNQVINTYAKVWLATKYCIFWESCPFDTEWCLVDDCFHKSVYSHYQYDHNIKKQYPGHKMVTIADMSYYHLKKKHKSLSMNHFIFLMILHTGEMKI